MEFNFERIPRVIYMEWDTEQGKQIVVYEDGQLIEDLKGVHILCNPNEYFYDVDREMGYLASEDE